MILKIDNVSKKYSGVEVLKKISFQINTGEIVGLLGKNGAGKSTLMKIITGFIIPDFGNVFIDEKKLDKSLQKKIGYLPETNPLYNDMFVTEYLDFFCDVYGVKDKQSKIKNLIDVCSLGKVYKKKIQTLSKGNRQRVGFARALLHDPEVLILDEPLTGFDPEQINNMLKMIKSFSKDKIILFSTHIMQEVINICSRVVVIENGEQRHDFSVKKCNIEILDTIFNS